MLHNFTVITVKIYREDLMECIAVILRKSETIKSKAQVEIRKLQIDTDSLISGLFEVYLPGDNAVVLIHVK